jgi:hypothetical protein
VTSCTFEANRHGISVGEGATLELSQSQLAGNGLSQSRQIIVPSLPLAVFGPGAHATVRSCVFANSPQFAVTVFGGGSLTLDDVEVSNARVAGLIVGDQSAAPAQAEIMRSRFHHSGTAIGVFAGSAATVTDGQIFENDDGIRVSDPQSRLEVRNTRFVGQREHGLLVEGEGRASVSSSEFRDNARGAVSGAPRRSKGPGMLTLENCLVGGNRVVGVGAYGKSELTLVRCDLEETNKLKIHRDRAAVVQNDAAAAPTATPADSEPTTSKSPEEGMRETEQASPAKVAPSKKQRQKANPRRRSREEDAARLLRRIFQPK